ncbi:MAG: HDOD domain-containing protein [Candidatus Polarisedimenticolaceae bacterium]|nr:HDOD domain-containing protein [Candidatus Polarisedimenticolaceae bacterium]
MQHPSVETLQHFFAFDELTADQRALLAKSLPIMTAPPGMRVIERGSQESLSYFLISGKIELQAEDGNRKIISYSDESAKRPIAQLIPRLYDVTATTAVEFIQVDNQLLHELSHQSESEFLGFRGLFSEFSIEETESELKQCLLEDLENKCLCLPSLPDVAVRIGKALNDEVTDGKHIAKIIQTDVAMTAKIIRVANSALYASHNPAENCTAAVVRLGAQTTHRLVLSFALRELFSSRSPIVQAHMHALWNHSRQVAAICYVLAKLTKQFNPEEAMLSGLLHDIGELVILSYAEKFPGAANDKHLLELVMSDLRGTVGGMVLSSWGFNDELVRVAVEAEDWQRNPTNTPDYVDLVIIAQLHSFIGTPRMSMLPMIDQVHAFSKLQLGDLTPMKSLKILSLASKQLAAAEALLQS